jgi:hypothetical protein
MLAKILLYYCIKEVKVTEMVDGEDGVPIEMNQFYYYANLPCAEAEWKAPKNQDLCNMFMKDGGEGTPEF